jgi:hypothetical protein
MSDEDKLPADMSDAELADEDQSIGRELRQPVSDGTIPIDRVVKILDKRYQKIARRVLIEAEQAKRAGAPGLPSLRADERTHAGDAFRFQTFRARGDEITASFMENGRKQTQTARKTFTIFVPKSAPNDKNRVNVFFTPLPDESNFVNEEGLRAEHEGSGWILVAVPGLFEDVSPNYVTISTAEIEGCLRAARRASASIDALRLTAHSRGHRGLERTIGFKGTPTVDLKLVERVTVFDASYEDLGMVLAQRTKDLVGMKAAGKPGWAPGAIHLIDVTVDNVSGLHGTRLGVSAMRGLFYARLVQNALALGTIDAADLATLKSDPKKDVQAATNTLLREIHARGTFSTRKPTPAGKTDLAGFLTDRVKELTLVDDAKDGLSSFVTGNNLDMGHRFDNNPKDPHRFLTAHHWIPAELTHESVD